MTLRSAARRELGKEAMIRIASIGECMIELRHRSASALDLAHGGDTLNTAVYLARLTKERDVRVDYVTALGDDAYSDGMLAMWRDEDIGTELVARLPGRLPGLYTIRTDARGERSFTYWRSASAARDMLRGARAEEIAEALESYDLLYLSGITLSILDPPQRAALVAIADRVREHGGRVVFDSNYRPVGWPNSKEARAAFEEMLARVDIALPTLDDEQALFGVKDALECADRLHRQGVAEIAIKLGGSRLLRVLDASSRARRRPQPVDQVVDSTAAGDSFNAGYLAARLLGAEAARGAARVGNHLAARVVAHPGAIIPADAMADIRPD